MSDLPDPNEPLDTRVVMKRVGYKDPKAFWDMARSEGLPYVRINCRKFNIYPRPFEDWLAKRSVGGQR